jgi:RNA polymerase sigma-B factor
MPDRRLDDRRLMRQHRAGDHRARHALIERYLPMARALALRYRHASEPPDDLVQVAALGLVKAVDRWQPERGLAFSTYAVPTILGELRRHFRDRTWDVRPPRDLQELYLAVEAARERLSAETGREPSVTGLARRLGRPAEAVREALQAGAGRRVSSLDAPVVDGDREPATVVEVVGAADEGFERAEARATLDRLSASLDDRAREILRLRFERDLLQSEIADRVGCSQMHVSRIIRASLDRMAIAAGA